jgi:uncharacterized protein YciI
MTDNDQSITPEFIEQEVARAKNYVLVLLMRGPRERNNQTELDDLQLKHLQHMFALRQEGKLILNGPSLIDTDFRGLCIFNVTDVDEARRWVDADPMVQAGYLTAQVYPWMGLPGDRLP